MRFRRRIDHHATGTAPPSSTSVPVRLRITYEPHGTAVGRRRWTLTCAPTGGDHPRRAAACAEIAAHPHALTPARRACRYAAVRGAPEALVVGTDRGVAVRRGFRPGCDPEWATLHALLRARAPIHFS